MMAYKYIYMTIVTTILILQFAPPRLTYPL